MPFASHVALQQAWFFVKAGDDCDGDAIMVPNMLPFGYMVNCPICKSGPHLIRDKTAADRCNHAYPPCGHVLRIDPSKPCKDGCERGSRKQPETREDPMPEKEPDYSEYE